MSISPALGSLEASGFGSMALLLESAATYTHVTMDCGSRLSNLLCMSYVTPLVSLFGLGNEDQQVVRLHLVVAGDQKYPNFDIVTNPFIGIISV